MLPVVSNWGKKHGTAGLRSVHRRKLYQHLLLYISETKRCKFSDRCNTLTEQAHQEFGIIIGISCYHYATTVVALHADHYFQTVTVFYY